jgi:hypothetical protein
MCAWASTTTTIGARHNFIWTARFSSLLTLLLSIIISHSSNKRDENKNGEEKEKEKRNH